MKIKYFRQKQDVSDQTKPKISRNFPKSCVSKAPDCLRGREKGKRQWKRKRGFSAALLSQEGGCDQNYYLVNFLHFLLLLLLLLQGFSTALV